MPWIPSHTNLGSHPKLKRAARLAEVGEPQMIGHLHLLWWWALDFAPDGDLSEFDVYDFAEGAGWQGDPDKFLEALIGCGPGTSVGFVQETGSGLVLHDWAEYGGRYGQRVAAARKAAEARWSKHKTTDAVALQSESVEHCDTDAEERRGEETEEREETEPRRKRRSRMTDDWQADSEKLAKLREQFAEVEVDAEVPRFRDYWISKGEIRADWDASLRSWIRNADRYRQERMGIQPGGWR